LLPSLENNIPEHPRALVVDDEKRIRRLLRINLEMEGFQVIEAKTGLDALDKVRKEMPDIVILDVKMPEIDGFETLRMIRDISNVPVLMLTVRDAEEDRVRGLDLGADDYLTKPFSPRELVSRVRAILRRVEPLTPPDSSVLKIDDRLSIDFNSGCVIVEGERIKLRPTELRLLRHLVENAGWTVPYSTLLSKVWGYEYKDELSYLRLYINYLRKKIEKDTSDPHYIITERGVGYRFIDFEKERTEDAEDGGNER